MFMFYLAGSLLLVAQQIMAQFNMYPDVDASLLATSLNISSGCLTALNATVNCDQTLFQMAGNVDAYFWADDNATSLCTSECLSSAASWWGGSASACEDDQLNAYGRLYPAETIPGRFLDGLNIACLKADTDISQDVGINGTIITFTYIGGENSTVNSTEYGDQTLPDTSFDRRQTSEASAYCLVQSYDWVGSDIIRPDCDDVANANESQCIDPTDVSADNSRIANLYPDTLLCSECFLKTFYLRLASPFLPDADESDFMVEQWFDILDVCNANSTMPELLVRMLPWYEASPGNSIDGSDNVTSIFTDPLPLGDNNTCSQRVITFTNFTVPTIDYTTQTPCDVLPPYLELSTGDVQQMMGNGVCVPNFNVTDIPSVCVPLPCNVTLMPFNTTCDQFAQSLSTSTNNVTVTQLLSWNQNFIGLCTNTTGQYVCTNAPGGTYIPPPVSNATSSDSGQQRGGGDGSGTATGSGGADGSSRNATTITADQTPPSPTQSGIPATCTKYAMALAGDGCDSFSNLFDITEQALLAWNPILGVDGANCGTLFWEGEYYCVGVSGSSTATSTTPAVTPTGVATPSPVQSGIDPQCTKYAEALSGSYCSLFASDNDITAAQLYLWNPILGTAGANCGTEFFANTYYCIGAPSGATTTATTTTTTPTGVATPSPVQSGIDPQCTKYSEALSGTYCSLFASDNDITAAQLYAWNPILGTDGANCGTLFYANTYYCVGAPPSPVQAGIDPQCTKYAEALSGTYCSLFASDNDITLAQLYTWNPILGTDGAYCGTLFYANTYYCVGAPSATATTTTAKAATTTSVTAPGPTQTGIAAACNKFAEVVSGDGCSTFASEHGITTAQLYAWNPVLGSGGANCGTSLWLNEYYCVGVSS